MLDVRCSEFRFQIAAALSQARAYSAMSAPCSKPETMTTRFAPAAMTCARLSDLDSADAKDRERTLAHGLVECRPGRSAGNRVWSAWRRSGRSRCNPRLLARAAIACSRLWVDLPTSNRPPDFLARGRDRIVVLPDVHAFHRHVARDLGVIVDDQRNRRRSIVIACSSCRESTSSSTAAVLCRAAE